MSKSITQREAAAWRKRALNSERDISYDAHSKHEMPPDAFHPNEEYMFRRVAWKTRHPRAVSPNVARIRRRKRALWLFIAVQTVLLLAALVLLIKWRG